MKTKNPERSLPALFFIILPLLFYSVSCTHEPVFTDAMDTICFQGQILPLLQNSCGVSGCHDGVSGVEGFSAASYQSVSKYVRPGDAHGSELYRVITDIWGENLMPPGKPLTLEQRTAIHVWIAQGALNTTCDQKTTNTGDTTNNGGSIIPSDSICFVQDILPIFNSGCATTNCHDAATHEEGYILTSYTNITSRSGSIIPFNPDGSRLFRAIIQSGEDRMPPRPLAALPSEQIDKIRTWIEEGALNSDCPVSTCDTSGIIRFFAQVWPIIQTNCVGCHNAAIASGNVNLDGYTQVKNYADIMRSGTPVLMGSIQHLNGFFPMPQNGKLQDCDIRKIELWVEQGKLNN